VPQAIEGAALPLSVEFELDLTENGVEQLMMACREYGVSGRGLATL